MFERRSRRFAVVLEDQDVLEPPVFFQVQYAIAEGPQDVFNALGRKGGQAGGMIGRFDNDLMRADPVHFVEHAFGLTAEIALNPERREFIGYDADCPARSVALWGRATIRSWPVGLNFGWGLGLVAIAKGAKAAFDLHIFADKVGGALGAVGRDD